MLFWICLIVFVILMVATVVCTLKLSYRYDWVSALTGTVAAILGFAIIVMCIIIGANHLGIDAKIDRLNTRYEILTYQYKNDVYDNDNDLGYRELMVDIQEWNEDLSYKKSVQDDFWLGVFHPNIYDLFEYIELK